MHEWVEGKLEEAKKIINGVVMYDAVIVGEINKIASLAFLSDGSVRYYFK
ncbi:hypothetical protein [Virgibacillus sp. Bac332]|nr:hypothetical protein [Virgibacillus sp. Bac332]